MTKKYNGHRNWNFWNVSLWINNDENLYRTAKYLVRNSANKTEAAKHFAAGFKETPDGAKYTVTAVRMAMADM